MIWNLVVGVIRMCALAYLLGCPCRVLALSRTLVCHDFAGRKGSWQLPRVARMIVKVDGHFLFVVVFFRDVKFSCKALSEKFSLAQAKFFLTHPLPLRCDSVGHFTIPPLFGGKPIPNFTISPTLKGPKSTPDIDNIDGWLRQDVNSGRRNNPNAELETPPGIWIALKARFRDDQS